MSQTQICPACQSPYAYFEGELWICPECAYEWNPDHEQKSDTIFDANGNELHNGDNVIVTKDLKVKGASSPIKAGTKIKNIRLVDSDDDHNVVAKIPGMGQIHIKQIYLKKA